jgi:biopolymer transport protein ExbB
MGKIVELVKIGDFTQSSDLLEDKKGPVFRVLAAGLAARKATREVLDSVLEEAILKELPRLEKFLPTLQVLAAIAPLLGLLGTVTGMINTFQVITVYGAGDPRMMSGGISEALITTELGLAVAIPIILLHTWFARRVDVIIGDMEEKSVSLSIALQNRDLNE